MQGQLLSRMHQPCDEEMILSASQTNSSSELALQGFLLGIRIVTYATFYHTTPHLSTAVFECTPQRLWVGILKLRTDGEAAAEERGLDIRNLGVDLTHQLAGGVVALRSC